MVIGGIKNYQDPRTEEEDLVYLAMLAVYRRVHILS
jgi:hypothetical protein